MNTLNSQKNAETERKERTYREMDRYIHYTVTLSELRTLV